MGDYRTWHITVWFVCVDTNTYRIGPRISYGAEWVIGPATKQLSDRHARYRAKRVFRYRSLCYRTFVDKWLSDSSSSCLSDLPPPRGLSDVARGGIIGPFRESLCTCDNIMVFDPINRDFVIGRAFLSESTENIAILTVIGRFLPIIRAL